MKAIKDCIKNNQQYLNRQSYTGSGLIGMAVLLPLSRRFGPALLKRTFSRRTVLEVSGACLAIAALIFRGIYLRQKSIERVPNEYLPKESFPTKCTFARNFTVAWSFKPENPFKVIQDDGYTFTFDLEGQIRICMQCVDCDEENKTIFNKNVSQELKSGLIVEFQSVIIDKFRDHFSESIFLDFKTHIIQITGSGVVSKNASDVFNAFVESFHSWYDENVS